MSPNCCCCSRSTDAASGDEKKQGVFAVGNQKPAVGNQKLAVDDFEITCKKFKKWVSKQSLPVETAITTITGAVPGAVMGAIVEAFFEGTCLATNMQSPSFGATLDPEILSSFGGYKPLVQSFVGGGALEQVRNFAVTTGVKSGISCVMKKLRGREDVQTSLVAGFGSGVMVSLVSGMRGPSVLSVGIVFALGSAGLFKLEEKYSQRKDVSLDKTRGIFSCMGLGFDHYPMNFNNGLLTDNNLPLLTGRKDVKIRGRRAWLRSS